MPTIKTITEALDGAVIGSVYPDSLSVAVFALSGEDTLSTSYAVEGNADFFLGGLADGDYTISFDPGELSGFQGKVIENVQRDVNIALINELFQIFSNLDIDTSEVLDAASTKWNFMKLLIRGSFDQIKLVSTTSSITSISIETLKDFESLSKRLILRK